LSIPFRAILWNFLKNIFTVPIDNDTQRVLYYGQMSDEVRAKLAELVEKGWTLANIARALKQSPRTVESWNQNQRSPANLQPVLDALDKLTKRKPPKKKIYLKGRRNHE
jgi:hypothetical protein